MKRYLKVLVLILCISLVIPVITACNKSDDNTVDIAMLMTAGSDLEDGSYNQSAREGIERYINGKNLKYKVYDKSSGNESMPYLVEIDRAVSDGAKIILGVGFTFEDAINEGQKKYPDVNFVLVDSTLEEVKDNTYCVLFAEQQAGFLAGYIAVKEGYTKLGYFGGMEIPPVMRYGYGFAYGAEFAAKELGLRKNSIEMNYNYCSVFVEDSSIETEAERWYTVDETEVIFACGGSIGFSIMASAQAYNETNGQMNKFVIGVDSDQSGDSECVITSAMKRVDLAVYGALEDFFEGEFKGGQTEVLDADKDGIGAVVSNRLKKFTQADYDAIYAKVKEETKAVDHTILKQDFIDTYFSENTESAVLITYIDFQVGNN